MDTTITIKDFGPISMAEIELKPLTIFIGRNNTGKSMLLYLLWILRSSMPNPQKVMECLENKDEFHRLIEESIRNIKYSAKDIDKTLKDLLRLYVECTPEGYSYSVREALRKTFGGGLDSVIREGASSAVVTIRTQYGELELRMYPDRVKGTWRKIHIDNILENILFEVSGVNTVTFYMRGAGLETTRISFEDDLKIFLGGYVLPPILENLLGFIPTEEDSALLVEGRAGITRTIMRSYPGLLLKLKDILLPDSGYIDLLYRLARDYSENDIVLVDSVVSDFLREFGIELIVRRELGIYRFYIRNWSGKVLPLEYSSSGIREAIPIALALLDAGINTLFIEEPEAHLHPTALKKLARLMAYAINVLNKKIIITTHSDNLVYVINNHIVLKKLSKKQLARLGYRDIDAIDYRMVSAYIIHIRNGSSVINSLEVGDDGFSEDVFIEIAKEIAEERQKIHVYAGIE